MVTDMQSNASDRAAPIATPMIGTPAPAFAARTTMGERALADYRGRWLVFFSHPADFTPVCTSEIIAFARAAERFAAIGCDLLGLSIDSLYSHLAWLENIRSHFGVRVPFPLIEDPSMAIARAYGMLDANAQSSATVRSTFVIDPDGIIRAMTSYPLSVGRSIEEHWRLVAALQHGDAEGVQTPAEWRSGEPTLAPAPVTAEELEGARLTDQLDRIDWYYRRIERGGGG